VDCIPHDTAHDSSSSLTPSASASLESTFLSGITDVSRKRILAVAEYRSAAAKGMLIRGGEKAAHLFLLHSGTARYYHVTKQGEEILLRWLVPGDVFGIGTLLKHPPAYIGSAQAVEECQVYRWTHTEVRNLLRDYPQLAENALRIAITYLSGYTERHSRLLSQTAEQRLARCLLNVSQRAGRHYSGGVQVDITNEQLGSLADVGLYTVSRILTKWERAGAIGKLRGRVLVKTPEKLLSD
jgi:CRP/FNR family transcriptional regulator, nitrogen oxide reductase regulator